MNDSRLTPVRADASQREWFARDGVGLHTVRRAPLNTRLELARPRTLRSTDAEIAETDGPTTELLVSREALRLGLGSAGCVAGVVGLGDLLRSCGGGRICRAAVARADRICGVHRLPHSAARCGVLA